MGRKKLPQPTEYTLRAHSVCKLVYHAVFVIKYRRKAINSEMMTNMQEYCKYLIESKYEGKLIEFNGESDHVHILFELPPTASPAIIVCNLKTQLSKRMKMKYEHYYKDKLWNGTFWSDSYFLTTAGGASVEILEQYIQQQGIEKKKRKYVKKKANSSPTD